MKIFRNVYVSVIILCTCRINAQAPPTTKAPTEKPAPALTETPKPATNVESNTKATVTPSPETTEATPEHCGPNSILAAFGYDCATCANQTVPCSLKREEKCYCIPGYVRDNKNNCILPTNCNEQNTCAANEFPASSGVDCLTCANYLSTMCSLEIRQGCYCRGGYIRISNSNRQCVTVQDCPTAGTESSEVSKSCPANAVYMTRNVNCKRCGLEDIDCSQHPPGCYCKFGYVYNNGSCVLPYQCPVNRDCIRRPPNCRGCYSTCNKRNNVFGYRAGRCALNCSRCMCSLGFVADSLGNCQPERNCRANSYVLTFIEMFVVEV